MLTSVNAAGFALPPMAIHRGKPHDSWRIGAQRHILVHGSRKGYINKKLFAEYGKMHAAGQLDKPNLLLMDSHYAHVFNYCFMQMMYRRDIKVFVLEPHTSHCGQPLDKTPSQHSRMASRRHAQVQQESRWEVNPEIRVFLCIQCGTGEGQDQQH